MATFHFTPVGSVETLEPEKASEDALYELLAIQSAYEDLAKLMDSGIPEWTFLNMLNDRFQNFLSGLGDPASLSD